jgi:hypothetical protein
MDTTAGQIKTAYNSTFAKGGVLCSKDTFVVIKTSVLLINICGESPALRVAAKLYLLFFGDSANLERQCKNEQT